MHFVDLGLLRFLTFRREFAVRHEDELVFVECFLAANLEKIRFLVAHPQDFHLIQRLAAHHEKSLQGKVGSGFHDWNVVCVPKDRHQ